MLRVTLLGPGKEEAQAVAKILNISQASDKALMTQIIEETRYLALKKENGDLYTIEDMIEFIPLEIGDKKQIYPAFKKHPEISIERTDKDDYKIVCEKSYQCAIRIDKIQKPVYRIKAIKVTDEELSNKNIFNFRCLGASEGFDPAQPSNGFLFRVNGKWILWDCPAYLNLHLKSIGIAYKDIHAVFISHVHEDHLDVMQSFRINRKTELYTTPEIFHCMILKLMAVLDCSYGKAASYYNFNPVYANRPFGLFGAEIEVFYTVHAIPALGLRLSVPKVKGVSKLFISGDHLSKRVIEQLDSNKVFTPQRKMEIDKLLPLNKKTDVAIVDAGSGMIHGDPQDYFDQKGLVYYIHTGKNIDNLPENHFMLKSGTKVNIH